jgi:3-oxoacyl-[acyl-carrier protein] reductase
MENQTKRLAVVTGATRGIGKAIAEELARHQCHVIITGRSDGNPVAAAIRQQGGEATFMQLDITQEEAVDNCFKEIATKFGGCDILVNNAGIAKDFLLMRSKVSDWQELINVNLIGTLLCSRAAIKQMIKKPSGRIINISSILGITGNPGQTVYSSTKAAIIGLTKSLAQEMASRNITVNAITPGFIDTEMTSRLNETIRTEYLKGIPLGRLGTGADIAPLVAFLASPQASYITSQIIGVNGGMA